MSQRYKTIKVDTLEIYATLDWFQFVSSQRIYFCKNATIIDLTTFKKKQTDELLVCVFDDASVANITCNGVEHVKQEKPCVFAQVVKSCNRREKHEVTTGVGNLTIGGSVFEFKKLFIRAELEKTIPERVFFDY